MKDEVPSRIKKHMGKLVEDVNLYTNHFLDHHIPKTSNHAEEYYCQTDPKKMKKRYKTPQGLVRTLNLKAVYWIVRHVLISEEESLRIVRQYLGNNTTKPIFQRFSPRKKALSQLLDGRSSTITHFYSKKSK